MPLSRPNGMTRKTAIQVILILGGFSIVGIMAVYLLFAMRIRTDLLNPPVIVRNAQGEVKQELVLEAGTQSRPCPGGEILWVVNQDVLRNTDAEILRSLKKGLPGQGVSVRDPVNLEPVATLEQVSLEAGNSQQGQRTFKLPVWLEPGNYYVLTSISTGATNRPVRYLVPFQLEEGCG